MNKMISFILSFIFTSIISTLAHAFPIENEAVQIAAGFHISRVGPVETVRERTSEDTYLCVHIKPPEVISIARWRLVGSTFWKSSGDTIAIDPATIIEKPEYPFYKPSVRIEFLDIQDWIKPSDKTVTIIRGTTVTVDSYWYLPQPVAHNDILHATEDFAKNSTLHASQDNGNPLNYTIVTTPTKGIVNITDSTSGAYTYQPDTNETGQDHFTFKAIDLIMRTESKPATINIYISPVNDPPVTLDVNVDLYENTYKYFTLSTSDPDSNTLVYNIIEQPLHGTISVVNNIATYTPYLYYNGPDSFTFKASDEEFDSNISSVMLTIYPVDTPPLAYPQTVNTTEDMPINLSLTGFSPDNLPLTYHLNTQPSNGTLSGTPPYLTYTPEPHFYGTDSFLFVANDGKSNSEPAVISITVVRSAAYVLKLVGSGYGTVSINETSVLLPYTISVETEKEICFEAVPDSDWQFINWTGDLQSTENSTCIIMDQNKIIRANMALKTFELNIQGNEPVTINNEQHNLPFSQIYEIHAPVVLESTSDRFNFWEKDILIDQNPYAFTINSDITITANFYPVPDWQTEMHLERWVDDSDVMQHNSVFFGIASQAYTKIASDLPDINSCHIILTNSSFVAMKKNFQQNNNTEYQWVISVDPHGNYGSPFAKTTAKLSWNQSSFSTEGQYVLTNDSGEIVVSDMRITTEYNVTDTSYTLYTIIWQRYKAFEFHLTQGWNLISLPISPSTTALEKLFPDYVAAYEYKNGSYHPVSSIMPGKGYWIKVPSSKVYSIAGQPFTSSATDYSDGWHLVGADYTETTPAFVPIKVIFRYVNGGYAQAFTLLPGFGYWIKLGSD
jgi:hypothetical protein